MRVQEGERRRRSDVGPRLTPRDAAALLWLSEMYGAPLDVVGQLLGTSRMRTYEVVRRWGQAGWVKRATPVPGPTWVVPTQQTARQFLQSERLRDWSPAPGMAAHTRAVAAVRLWLGYPPGREGWTSERVLRAESGFRRTGDRLGHLVDGVAHLPADEGSGRSAREVLVEVELTPKGRTRTAEVVHEVIAQSTQRTARSDVAPRVLYVCTRAAVAGVQAAAAESEVGHRVRVEALDAVPLALRPAW